MPTRTTQPAQAVPNNHAERKSNWPSLSDASAVPQAKANPGPLSPASVLQLQQTIGNRAVMRMLTKGAGTVAPGTEMTVQREVKPVPWVKGKWFSTYDPKQQFTSVEEATVFDNEKKAAAAAAADAAAEDAWADAADAAAWVFSDAAGRLTKHFNDGWGAAYGIQSKNQIKQRIIDENGPEELGEHEIYLGNYTVKGQTSGCNIVYENILVPISAGGITRDALQTNVFHCGPGKGAG